MASNRLNISVGIHQPQSRAELITSATLPDASEIGIKLDGYDDADNIKFTAATDKGNQVWNPASDIVLDENKGTLYAYYPYAAGTNLIAIPVETASQTDYLYAEPVANVSEKNANVPVTMKHMLANVKIAINKGTYVGTGNISKIAIQSDGFATGGTFNAAQLTPAFTAVTGTGEAITQTVNTTLGGTATNIMVVPTGTSKALTFTATIDDVDYTVTSSDVELEEGNSYEYTLSLNSTFMSIASVAVKNWTPVTKESLTLEKEDVGSGNTGSGPAIDATGKANGVYVVTATGQLVDKTTVAADAIGVALITANQRILIEKNGEANTDIIKAAYDADGASNTSYTYFYWGCYIKDVAGIENTSTADAARQDFDGKANTAAIIATPDTDSKTTFANMGTYCTKFNEMSGTYADWYIPALGQLYEIYGYVTDINTALTNIGGTKFDMSRGYFSSSEKNADKGWYIRFNDGIVNDYYGKDNANMVRFIRDIAVGQQTKPEPETSTGPTINSAGKANGVYVVTATGQLVDKSAATADCIGVAFISANQKVMIPKANVTSGTKTTLYWGYYLNEQDVPNLENLANNDVAIRDFNGKSNTAAIIAGYAALGKIMDIRDMCYVLETYNEGGYTDWYIPACGQLYEFYSNRTAINEALTAIGGNEFTSYGYWTSSEKDAEIAFDVSFKTGGVDNSHKNMEFYVRFVRDIN